MQGNGNIRKGLKEMFALVFALLATPWILILICEGVR